MTYNKEQFGSANIFTFRPPDGDFRFLQITADKRVCVVCLITLHFDYFAPLADPIGGRCVVQQLNTGFIMSLKTNGGHHVLEHCGGPNSTTTDSQPFQSSQGAVGQV